MPERNVLMIGGHRKSGTTMLQRLFEGHPALWTPPHDLNVLYAYHPEYCREGHSQQQRAERLRRVVLDDWRRCYQSSDEAMARWQTFEAYYHENVDAVALDDIEAVVNFLVRGLWAVAPESTNWLVLKETSSEMYASWLLGGNPEFRFLHLFREPKDNFAALKAGQQAYYSLMHNDLLDTMSSAIIRYKLGVHWMQRNRREFGDRRYRILRFEDLVGDAQQQMVAISKWLGISWDPCLLQPSLGGKAFSGNSHDGMTFSGISSKNVGRWAERISSDEAAVIDFLLEQEMALLNYPRAMAEYDAATKASQWYAAMNWKYFFGDRFSKDAPL